MTWPRARFRQLGYAFAAIDLVMALLLVMQPSALAGWKIEATLLVVLLAVTACWLIVVE